MKNHIFIAALLCLLSLNCQTHAQTTVSAPEQYRPQVHFTPEAHWMNDPNGMVYFKGTYHLFYQYYPGGTEWGPMHWAHATSKDLVHWSHLPVALYPDSLGYIFSGSAVVDVNNTSGFGKNGQVPLVAIFTHHNQKGEQAHRNDYQNQSLAYSLDEGMTWQKYLGNPVLPNPGITDFRDPKVMWFERDKKWVMTLATKDHVTFYSSPDLKSWIKESEFGKAIGAHGGVWECPDLFPLTYQGKTYWVLFVSINPGAPNGGSGTQYFIGEFNGKTFQPINNTTRWIDYGTDNYAGITWSNTGARKVFIGWMNNWLYANKVPTVAWRGATTLPREFQLVKQEGMLSLSTIPVSELKQLEMPSTVLTNVSVKTAADLSSKLKIKAPFKLDLKGAELRSFALSLDNDSGDKLVFGFDKVKNQYYVDRRSAGDHSFDSRFSGIHYAPRVSTAKGLDITIFVDVASIEVFADSGLSVMTEVFFPTKPLTKVFLLSNEGLNFQTIKHTPLNSITSK